MKNHRKKPGQPLYTTTRTVDNRHFSRSAAEKRVVCLSLLHIGSYASPVPRPTERIRPSAWRMKANNASSGRDEPVTTHTSKRRSVLNGAWVATVSGP